MSQKDDLIAQKAELLKQNEINLKEINQQMHKYLSEYNMSVTPDTPTKENTENSNLSYQDLKNQLKSHKMLVLDNEQTIKF